MAPRRGNSTSYHRSVRTANIDDPVLKGRPALQAFEEMWRRSVSRDPLCSAHDRGRAGSFAKESINGGDVARALEFLADMTGDEAFLTAALALRSYGLARGGLKQHTLRLVREQYGTAVWAAMPCMHSWRRTTSSDSDAAARTAIELGIPGQSFESVTDELRKAYPEWLKALEDKTPAQQIQSGDTGRKLRVRFTVPWLGADNEPITELMGVHFDQDGYGIAPDNREWRRLIHQGHIALYGVLEPVLGKNSERHNRDVR